MNDKEWREFVARMHSPEVQAIVTKYEPEPEAEEPAEAVQTALWEEMSDE